MKVKNFIPPQVGRSKMYMKIFVLW